MGVATDMAVCTPRTLWIQQRTREESSSHSVLDAQATRTQANLDTAVFQRSDKFRNTPSLFFEKQRGILTCVFSSLFNVQVL